MSNYKGLWWILAVGLLVITIISFCDDFSIFGWKFKKSPIAETLLKERISEEKALALKHAKEAEVAQKLKAQENAVDTLPKTFLIFGDSMTENIALRIASYAKHNGHKIHTVNWDKSGTRIWSQTDTLDYYIDLYKPTYIFIALGSNESYARNIDTYRSYVQALLKKIGDIPYVWIGPPKLNEEHGFNDMLLEETAAGTFFRADGLELERRKDKIHPTRQAAAYMVDSIMRWLPKSAHPIKMNLPPDTVPEPKIKDAGIVYLKPMH